MTIHCLVNKKEHIQETVVLPVGTEAVKELEKESAKHNHHH
ncbi:MULTISPECIES: hypothetical protein [Neobacillus]|nr:hypothetical protein [Neobacillus sedimentimangrovi]